MNPDILNRVLSILEGHTLSVFIQSLLSFSGTTSCPTARAFIGDIAATFEVLQNHCTTCAEVSKSTIDCCSKLLAQEVAHLANKESGWHFSARNASAAQIHAFSIQDMATKLENQAPYLWNMLGILLQSENTRSAPAPSSQTSQPNPERDVSLDYEAEYWELEEERMERGSDVIRDEEGSEVSRRSKRQRRAAERTPALHHIKRVVIMSILMMSKNQRCNPIAAVVGIFCHSTSTPELLVEMLAHMGLLVSLTSIHDMVSSLSEKSHIQLRRMASSSTASFAYDNFDMDFKSWLPTLEKLGDTLKHATSALAIPLTHGVTADDLKCSAEMWNTDPNNISVPDANRPPLYTWMHCLPAQEPPNIPSHSVRIIAWHFRHVLVTFADGFSHFRDHLGSPETILQIPVTKATFEPCRSMDINQSTSDGQAQIIENILTQAHLGDPTDHTGVMDIREHVSLWHGDLRTGELIELARRSRSIESKPVRRLQFIIFVMGLFHYQMACSDAIWRMFIEPPEARRDPAGLYQQICKVRPHDSGRIASKPSFRMMHDIIHQCAYAKILDCWRVDCKKAGIVSLEEYAASKPSWDEITERSLNLASSYLDKPVASDQAFRNNSLILAWLIQYIELTHAMKHGDIGRVEATFLHWVFVFKSVGKHKYATHLIKTMINMKYKYNDRLKHVIRMHWLCNPTGKADGFRAVDWLVELMNLYTKVVYGSSGSARTFQLILKQSPLIEIFRKIHTLIQDNFHLLHRSIRHAPPDIRNTIQVLLDFVIECKAHEFVDAREVHFKFLDHFVNGMRVMQKEPVQATRQSTMEAVNEEGFSELELELGDLEV